MSINDKTMTTLLQQMSLPVITEQMAEKGEMPIRVDDIHFDMESTTMTVIWSRTRETSPEESADIHQYIHWMKEAMKEDWCDIADRENVG